MQLGAAALSSRRGAATGRITQKSYQRIFDEIFWRGVVVESFRGLWMFQKKIIVHYQSTYCTFTIKTVQTSKHWGRKTAGEAVEAEGREIGWGLGRQQLAPAYQLGVWGAL